MKALSRFAGSMVDRLRHGLGKAGRGARSLDPVAAAFGDLDREMNGASRHGRSGSAASGSRHPEGTLPGARRAA